MDRLTAMEVFVQAVDAGSFSAAGDVLDMSPQLVGKHVQRLEEHLGVKLLHRTTRRQSLTGFGAAYCERARVILADIAAAETLAAEARAAPTGRLRVNAPVSFGIHTLSPKLAHFMRQCPEVTVDLSLNNRNVDLVEEGFDIAFRVGELPDSGLMAKRLAPYSLVLCAAPSYLEQASPLTSPADLAHHPCLVYAHTELRKRWTFDGPEGRVSVEIAGSFIADHGEPILAAARAGLGVILQPLELVAKDVAAGKLRTVLPDYKIPTRPLHLVYAPDRRATPKLRAFIEFATREFGGQSSR
ncbi:LysR family transcriptional regulator [Marinibacterium sp. SX1]|uniref:LysR family transcriptional regulator n=1 Tax=Marinibacterium sp. SX1 TaxID=3388424 RepID=UPI003D183789